MQMQQVNAKCLELKTFIKVKKDNKRWQNTFEVVYLHFLRSRCQLSLYMYNILASFMIVKCLSNLQHCSFCMQMIKMTSLKMGTLLFLGSRQAKNVAIYFVLQNVSFYHADWKKVHVCVCIFTLQVMANLSKEQALADDINTDANCCPVGTCRI